MAKDLIIGSAGIEGFEDSLAEFLAARGLNGDIGAWSDSDDTIATISCLNGAAVMSFLGHVLRLEGYTDKAIGFAAGADGKTSAKNLPWWDNSIWLPLEFDNPGGLEDDPTFFVGSCVRLVAELDKLRHASPLQLGTTLPAYNEMRSDFLKFARSDVDLGLSEEDCVRWVWRALRDGAELAIAKNAVLWAGPD